MRVKAGGKVHDGSKEPIAIFLSDFDKNNIANMGEAQVYCVWPDDAPAGAMEKFMQDPDLLQGRKTKS